MKILFQLAINSIRKYKRESFLVVLSTALTISMITLVAIMMTSIYATTVEQFRRFDPFNVTIVGVKDARLAISEIGLDQLDYYEIKEEGTKLSIYSEHGLSTVSNYYVNRGLENVSQELLAKSEISEGKMSTSERELVVSKDSKHKLNDVVILTNNETGEEIESVVVGRTKGLHEPYYSDETIFNIDKENNSLRSLSLIFKPGVKNIDNKLESIKNSGAFVNDVYFNYNQDYNFLNGYQSSPGPTLYVFLMFTVVLISIVSIMTVSLILNSYDTLFSQKIHTFNVLRSVGTTKSQMRFMILFEGLLLSAGGLVLGIFLGNILSSQLLSVINNIVLKLNAVEYGMDRNMGITYSFPNFILYLIILVSLITVVIALLNRIKHIYKNSAVDNFYNLNLKKRKNQKSLNNNPIKGMAKINVKLSKEYGGIKTALFIITVVVIIVNGWLSIGMSYTNDYMQVYDTIVYAVNLKGENIDDEINAIRKINENFEEVENELPVYLSEHLYLSFDKHEPIKIDPETNVWNSPNIKITVLEDKDFEEFKENFGLSKEVNTIFYNQHEYFEGNEIVLDLATSIKDGDNLYLEYYDQSSNVESAYPIFIDKVLTEVETKYNIFNFMSPILVSKSYYEENLMNDFLIEEYSLHLQTTLTPERIKEFNNQLSEISTEIELGSYSNLGTQYIKELISKAVIKVSIIVFAYISLVILFNIISISLSNIRKRKKDIAILKSLGANSKQVERLFVFEITQVLIKPWIYGVIVGSALTVFLINLMYEKVTLEDYLLVFSNNYSYIISLSIVILIVIIVWVSIRFESKKNSIVEGIKNY